MIPKQTTDFLTGLTYIDLNIQHQPHASNYMTPEEYVNSEWCGDISEEEKKECIRTGEIWEIHWYPDTPIGFYKVTASTLEKAIQIAKEYK